MTDYNTRYLLRKESRSGTILLREEDPKMVNRMISFFYTGKYTPSEDFQEGFSVHAVMYALGDKYDCQTLKARALGNHEHELNCFNLSEESSMKAVIHSSTTVYTATPTSDRGLRDLFTGFGCECEPELQQDKSFGILMKSNLDDGQFTKDVPDGWHGEGLPPFLDMGFGLFR